MPWDHRGEAGASSGNTACGSPADPDEGLCCPDLCLTVLCLAHGTWGFFLWPVAVCTPQSPAHPQAELGISGCHPGRNERELLRAAAISPLSLSGHGRCWYVPCRVTWASTCAEGHRQGGQRCGRAVRGAVAWPDCSSRVSDSQGVSPGRGQVSRAGSRMRGTVRLGSHRAALSTWDPQVSLRETHGDR